MSGIEPIDFDAARHQRMVRQWAVEAQMVAELREAVVMSIWSGKRYVRQPWSDDMRDLVERVNAARS